MYTAHRIRTNPTPEQLEYLKRASGTRRFIYNWGREQWEKQYQAYKAEQEIVPEEQRVLIPPNAFALKKQFNEIREQECPWTYQVTKCVVEGAFDDLKKAYDNFFGGRAAYPQYKKKGRSHESFYLSNDTFTLSSHWIAIPGLGRFILDQRQQRSDRGHLRRKLGTVNLAEKLRFVEEGKATAPSKKRNQRKQVVCERVKILGATVSCEAGHWYVSIQVEIKKERPPTPTPVVGVDVGLKQAAVVSDGRRLENVRRVGYVSNSCISRRGREKKRPLGQRLTRRQSQGWTTACRRSGRWSNACRTPFRKSCVHGETGQVLNPSSRVMISCTRHNTHEVVTPEHGIMVFDVATLSLVYERQ